MVDNFCWIPDAATGGLLSDAAAKPLGETTDKWFMKLNAFELLSFQMGSAHAETSGSSSTGSAAGRASFEEFSIEKTVDLASVPLYGACCAGAHFPTIMLACRKAGGSPLLFLMFIFRMVFVTSITWSGGDGEGAVKESIKFKYGALGMQYTRQLPSGEADTPIPQYWSMITNKNELTVPQIKGSTPTFPPVTQT
jgi:type VI protein secretion system component Hcp